MNTATYILKISYYSIWGFILLIVFGTYLNWQHIEQIDIEGLRGLVFPGLASYLNYLSLQDLISKNVAKILIIVVEPALTVTISLYLGFFFYKINHSKTESENLLSFLIPIIMLFMTILIVNFWLFSILPNQT